MLNIYRRMYSSPRYIHAISLLFILLLISPHTHALPTGFTKDTVLQGLVKPVNIVQMPDGRMFVLEKGGKIKLFNPSQQSNGAQTLLTLTDINSGQERGLASIALDPKFNNNGYLYIYYTQQTNDARNRIARFTFANDQIERGSEVLVWEDNAKYKSCCHYGGGLDFGPDQKLYLTTGEEFDGEQAQDLTQAGGKIIRLNIDNVTSSTPWVRGATNTHIIPSDNPAYIRDGPGGNLDEIWALGLRNPFRAHWDIQGNRFFIGEVGGNQQSSAREDLHLGRAGANFGWPFCEGQCSNGAYDDPVYDYGHTQSTPAGGAIVAGVVYRDTQFPIEYQGRFFIADYALGFIKYVQLNSNDQFQSITDFDTAVDGAPVAIEQGSDGSLYVVDYSNGRILKYSYNPDNQPPVITLAKSNANSGQAPLFVTLSANATDADGDLLSYSWSLGDGLPNRIGQNVTTTYNENGVYYARVSVSDGTHTRQSELIEITVGTTPVAKISSPVNNRFFQAADQISFEGVVENSDPQNQYSYSWEIEFVHNAHTHPVLDTQQSKGSFEIARTGHDYLSNTSYRLNFTVTDALGLTDTDSVTIFPSKVDMLLHSTPENIPVFVDGVQLETPITYDTLIGFNHVLSAEQSTCINGQKYTFERWSNNLDRVHTLTIPNQDFTLQAIYNLDGNCSSIPFQGLAAWYEADTNVTTNEAGVVTSWLDKSGNDNHLTVVHGNPTLRQNELNSKPAIWFDGSGDSLQRTGSLTNFSFGAADRSVFLVAKYNDTGSGGIGYGSSSRNKVFGLSVDSNGKLRVNGFGPGNDFITTSLGTGAGWLLHEAQLKSNNISQYLNGDLIKSADHTFNTAGQKFVLGADLDENPFVNMNISAILVYNRSISASERQSVYQYLEDKYFSTTVQNIPPIANADSGQLDSGGEVTLNILSNDSDPDGNLNDASVWLISLPENGIASINDDLSITYLHDGSDSTTDTFTYQIIDADGATSNIGSVNLTIYSQPNTEPSAILPTSGLVVHLDADLDITTTQTGTVISWGDQSGLFNDMNETGGDPQILNGIFNGHNVVAFDGDGDYLLRNNGLVQLPTGASDRSIFALVQYKSSGYGGISYGSPNTNKMFGIGVHPKGNLMIQGWGAANDFNTGINAASANWFLHGAVMRADQITHFMNLDTIDSFNHNYSTDSDQLVIGAEIDGNPSVEMSIATLLIYDRAVTELERQSVYRFLYNKYFVNGEPDNSNQAPLANNDSARTLSNGQVNIPILNNDVDVDGELIFDSVLVQQPPASGTVLFISDGSISYTHGSNTAVSDAFTYNVADDQGLRSNIATVSIDIEQPEIPVNTPTISEIPGLVVHYEANAGITTSGNNEIIQWNDQTVNANDLLSDVDGPTILSSTLNGYPVISFDGVDDKLSSATNLIGVPSGSADRSLYTVINYLSKGYGGVSYGSPILNETYGHSVHPNRKLMIQGWGAEYDAISNRYGSNRNWFLQSSFVTNNKLTHHVNDVEIDSRIRTFNTSTEKLVIGSEIDGTPFVKMQVATILLFDRALSATEHQQILSILNNKYDLW